MPLFTENSSFQRIEFANGWTIDVHEVHNGQVYYRRWKPGVEHMSFFEGLHRMDLTKFQDAVELAQGITRNAPCTGK